MTAALSNSAVRRSMGTRIRKRLITGMKDISLPSFLIFLDTIPGI
jgi:hypothetical protein